MEAMSEKKMIPVITDDIVNEILNRDIRAYEFFLHSPIPAVMISSSGYFTAVNFQFTKMVGYTDMELSSMPFLMFIHKSDMEKTRNCLLKMRNRTDVVCNGLTSRFRVNPNSQAYKKGEYVRMSWYSSKASSKKGLTIAQAIFEDYE